MALAFADGGARGGFSHKPPKKRCVDAKKAGKGRQVRKRPPSFSLPFFLSGARHGGAGGAQGRGKRRTHLSTLSAGAGAAACATASAGRATAALIFEGDSAERVAPFSWAVCHRCAGYWRVHGGQMAGASIYVLLARLLRRAVPAGSALCVVAGARARDAAHEVHEQPEEQRCVQLCSILLLKGVHL